MPLLDLVCMGCCEVVCGAVGLGFEDAVFKGRVGIFGDTLGKGRFDVAGEVIGNDGMVLGVIGSDGIVLDVRVEGSLSDIGTEDRSVDNSDRGELLDKGDDHGESVLSKGYCLMMQKMKLDCGYKNEVRAVC